MKNFAKFRRSKAAIESNPRRPNRAMPTAEIDRLVYELYALTEEEIAIVEGKK